jgi:uncharacterized protein YndB with AHSA1/START domain
LNRDLSLAPDSVCVERSLSCSPVRAWEIVGSSAGMQRWMGFVQFQARLNGRILLDTSTTGDDRIVVWGRICRWEPERCVSFGWRVLHESGQVWPVETVVSVELEEHAGACLARLTHSGFAALGEAAPQAYSVYHHCWVETQFMPRLQELSGATD